MSGRYRYESYPAASLTPHHASTPALPLFARQSNFHIFVQLLNRINSRILTLAYFVISLPIVPQSRRCFSIDRACHFLASSRLKILASEVIPSEHPDSGRHRTRSLDCREMPPMTMMGMGWFSPNSTVAWIRSVLTILGAALISRIPTTASAILLTRLTMPSMTTLLAKRAPVGRPRPGDLLDLFC